MNLNHTYQSSCSVPIISETFSLLNSSQNSAETNSYNEDYNLPDLVSDNDSDCDSDIDSNSDIEFDSDNMNQNLNNFNSMENEKLMKLIISVVSQSINEKFNLKLSIDKISNILISLIKFLKLSLNNLIKNLIILEKLLVFFQTSIDLELTKRIILISFMLGSNETHNNHHNTNINNIRFDEWSKITGLSKKSLMIELIKLGRLTGDFNNFVNVSDNEIQSLNEFLKIEVNKYVKLL